MAVLQTTLAEANAQLRRYEGDSVSPAWATSTVYAVGDKVYINGLSYKCPTGKGHTSGVFATDLAAGKWELYETAIELIRAWPNIDANYSKSLIDGINDADSVTDPQASGITFTGIFYSRKPWAEEDGERSVTIFQHLTTTTLAAEYFDYENRSIAAYTAVKNPKTTSTREVFENEKTAPTLTEEFGFLSYIKNIFGRFSGTKSVVTYNDGTTAYKPPTDKLDQVFYVLIEQKDPTVQTTNFTTTKYKWLKYTYDLTYEQSESDAYAAITNGLPGSRVWRSYSALWGAKYVKSVYGSIWLIGRVVSPTF